MSLPEALAVVDVETTGANPVHDRVTEIGILRIEHGELVEKWSSLVNPGMSIPRLIQGITGIDDDMVRDAPRFGEIAGKVRELLDGGIFVAHNARFDFGFISNEFRRLEQEFSARVLCTVKLSRALYPQHHRHGLDALIQRHDLQCSARHRALGDAEVLWDFLLKARAAFAQPVLTEALERAMKRQARPAGLAEGLLESIPPTTGAYLFYSEPNRRNAVPLYVGKSVNLRSRVSAHFRSDHRRSKDAELAQQVKDIEVIETAGELGALLLESRLIQTRKPLHNRILRRNQDVRGLRLRPNRRKPPVLEKVKLADTDPVDWADEVFGVFRNKREIDNTLHKFAELHRLCPTRLGLERGASGPCLAHQMGRCAGVCAGNETPAEHDARLADALVTLKLTPWQWQGPIAVREYDERSDRTALHVIDHWCLLGSVGDEGELDALLDGPPARRFDIDTYRILTRWLASPKNTDTVRVLAR